MSKEDIALGMVALKYAMDRVKPAQDELRRQARELLTKKERIPATVDGEVVGTINKSSPPKAAKVVGEAAFREWVQEHYPEHVRPIPYVEDMAAAIRVLEEHALHLVHYHDEVSDEIRQASLSASEQTGVPTGPGGEADVPGITVDTPEGNVTVLMEKGNEYLVEQMLTSGQVSLDGTVRREIEG